MRYRSDGEQLDGPLPATERTLMTRLMSTALVTSIALAGCADLHADRNGAPLGSPDSREMGTPAAPQDPNASTGASTGQVAHSDEYAEPIELDEGKF
jgi:hypothetical protein